jgi:uncharacterized membrane protein
MALLALAEAVLGGVLLFFLPGFAVAKALFPERRCRGPNGVRWLVELLTLGLVVSVVLTVGVGYVLLAAAPGGFSASWSDPLLEAILAAIALIAFVVGGLEGAYARTPPAPIASGEGPGEAGAWELTEQLDRLLRQRRGLEQELARTPSSEEAARAGLRARLAVLGEEETALRRTREADYEL